jgi:hypothetical protein
VLFATPAARSAARRYYLDGMRDAPIHDADSALELARASAHPPTAAPQAASDGHDPFSLIERYLRPAMRQYSPGFAAVVTLAALRSCKAEGKRDAELTACVERVSAPARFTVGHDLDDGPAPLKR